MPETDLCHNYGMSQVHGYRIVCLTFCQKSIILANGDNCMFITGYSFVDSLIPALHSMIFSNSGTSHVAVNIYVYYYTQRHIIPEYRV